MRTKSVVRGLELVRGKITKVYENDEFVRTTLPPQQQAIVAS
jgi:hypothetical protein